jgi:hypothetical protein
MTGLIGLLTLCLALQACGLGSAGAGHGDSASGPLPSPPMYDVGLDGSFPAKWQADTAHTVARLLTRQEKGVVIAETTGDEPQVAEALRAAAALRQLGWRTTVKLGVEIPDGLVREDSQEPLLLTRLRVLATGETSATLRAAVRERLRAIRPGLLRQDLAAITATVSGVDVLERAGDLQATDLPAGGLCPTAGEDRRHWSAFLGAAFRRSPR